MMSKKLEGMFRMLLYEYLHVRYLLLSETAFLFDCLPIVLRNEVELQDAARI